MKHILRAFIILCMIAAIALTAACGSSSKEEPTYATGTDSEDSLQPTDAPDTAAAASDPSAGAQSSDSSDAAYKTELVDHRWNLSAVYKDGEAQSIGVTYGSVIRQTGAYIAFSDDDTFQCVLGFVGCKGAYSVENGDLTLHITTKYDGSNDGESCDEDAAVDWDHDAGTLSFDFYGVTNEFTKQD